MHMRAHTLPFQLQFHGIFMLCAWRAAGTAWDVVGGTAKHATQETGNQPTHTSPPTPSTQQAQPLQRYPGTDP